MTIPDVFRENNDLKTWLNTGVKRSYLRKTRKNKKAPKKADSIEEEYSTPRGISTRSMLSSIFSSESQGSSQAGEIKELGKKMEVVGVEDRSDRRRSKRLKDAGKDIQENLSDKRSKKDIIRPGDRVVSDFEEENIEEFDDFLGKGVKKKDVFVNDDNDSDDFHDAAENLSSFDAEIPDIQPRAKKTRKEADKITDADDKVDFKNLSLEDDFDEENLSFKSSNKKKSRQKSSKMNTLQNNQKENKKTKKSAGKPDSLKDVEIEQDDFATSNKKSSKKLKKDKEVKKPANRKSRTRAVFSYKEDEDVEDSAGGMEAEFEEDSVEKVVAPNKKKSPLKRVENLNERKIISNPKEDLHQEEIESFEELEDVLKDVPIQEKTSKNQFFKTTDHQNITIDDVEVDEMFGFWDDIEEEENRKKKLEDSQCKEKSSVKTKVLKNIKKGKGGKDTPKKVQEKPEKANIPAALSNIGKADDYSSANDETFEEIFKDATSKSPASTNPFAKVTKAVQNNTRVGRIVEKIQSDDENLSDFMSEESESDNEAPTSPLTQKSTATVRTHISDFDVMDLLFDDDKNDNQKEGDGKFGAFSNVIRDVHSQSSQNIQSLHLGTTQKAKFGAQSDMDLDAIFSSDDTDSGSDNDNPFANALRNARKDAKSPRSVMSPVSSDGEDDNFASMFGFGQTKKKGTNRRQG